MKLNIIKGDVIQCSNGCEMIIGIDYLRFKSSHLFMAAHIWEALYLELDNSIPLNCLKYITVKPRRIQVELPEQLTVVTMCQLIELFPEKEGMIREAFEEGTNSEELQSFLADMQLE